MSQQRWIERAKETHKFHRAHCVLDDDWNMTRTAKALRRSIGSVCEDLKIASWLKTHEKELEKFEYAYQAIEFINKKKREIDLAEIE